MPKAKSILFFDKVAITIPIPKPSRLDLLKKVNNPEFHSSYNRKVYSDRKGRYKNNYQFTIANKATIEVSLYPIKVDQNFIRIEYNPAKLGKEGRKQLRVFIVQLIGISLAKRVYFDANVTRVDLTLDNYQMESNLYIYKPKSKTSSLYRQEEGNRILSQVIGSDASDIRITLYDKKAQLLGINVGSKKATYQRLEIRYRLRGLTIATLNDALLKDIKSLHFYCDGFLTDDRFDSAFIADAYHRGLNYAMSQINDSCKRRNRTYLADYRAFPIPVSVLNFDYAHYVAFNRLLHPDFRNKELIRQHKSLLKGVVLPGEQIA